MVTPSSKLCICVLNASIRSGRVGYSHTSAWLGDSAVMTLVFEIFDLIWNPLPGSYWPTLSTDIIGLSLSNLFPGIYSTGLIYHKNILYNSFYFLRSSWPLFSLVIDIFAPSFWQNLTFDWVHFSSCAGPF